MCFLVPCTDLEQNSLWYPFWKLGCLHFTSLSGMWDKVNLAVGTNETLSSTKTRKCLSRFGEGCQLKCSILEMFASRLVSNRGKAELSYLMPGLKSKFCDTHIHFHFKQSCSQKLFRWTHASGTRCCHPRCSPLCHGNDFSAVVMLAPSDLHFLFVWCSWVEGHDNGSL